MLGVMDVVDRNEIRNEGGKSSRGAHCLRLLSMTAAKISNTLDHRRSDVKTGRYTIPSSSEAKGERRASLVDLPLPQMHVPRIGSGNRGSRLGAKCRFSPHLVALSTQSYGAPDGRNPHHQVDAIPADVQLAFGKSTGNGSGENSMPSSRNALAVSRSARPRMPRCSLSP